MKRLSVALTATILVAALGGGAAAGRARTVTVEYEPVTIGSGSISSRSSADFERLPGERFVSIVIEDALAPDVPARLTQDVDGDDKADFETEFCTATEEPVWLKPGAAVSVWRLEGTCGELQDGRPGAWSEGTITATFTR